MISGIYFGNYKCYVNVNFILRSFILVFALFRNKITMRDDVGLLCVVCDDPCFRGHGLGLEYGDVNLWTDCESE